MLCRQRVGVVVVRVAGIVGAAVALASSGAFAASPSRGYEMVSPVDKEGADVMVSDGSVLSVTHQASPGGQSVAFGSSGGFAGAPSSVLFGYFLSRREGNPVDWGTSSLNSMQRPFSLLRQYSLFANSLDLSHTLFGSRATLAPGAVEGDGNLYLRNNQTGEIELVAHDSSSDFRGQMDGNDNVQLYVMGTPDFGRIAFNINVPLTPDSAPGVKNTYEWSRAEGLRLVNYAPDETVDPMGGTLGRSNFLANGANAMSADGRRVFFTGGAASSTFMREAGRTVLVSASQATGDDPSVPRYGQFELATADGRRVLFYSTDRLTDASNADSVKLYEYDADARTLRDVTLPDDPGYANPPFLRQTLGMSGSGDYIYFSAEGVLAPGGVSGMLNIYVNHDGVISLVTSIDGAPSENQQGQQSPSISPDGQYFTFLSVTPPAGYDNVSPACATSRSDSRCGMVFVYDAVSDELSCASCFADGTRSGGPAFVGGQANKSAPGVSNYFARAALDSGVYFDSPDGLVRGDVNNRYDVYHFHDGQIELVTSGNRGYDARFVDAGVSGDDVFFTTRQSLVRQDVDDSTDVYDARVGGGLALQNPPEPRTPCEGIDCRRIVAVDPQLPQITSQSDLGNDEVVPPPSPRRVSVSRRSISRGGLTVWVKAPGAGTVSIKGRWLTTKNVKVKRAGTVRVVVRLDRSGRRTLARRHRISVRARVTFRPTRGASSSQTVSATARANR